MKKQPNKYYNILTTEGSNEATILLYGYIGESYDWYTGEKDGVTDVDFVKELDRLAAQYNTIHVRINSPGGEVFHGSAIVTAIRNCKAEVNTWIDGVAASMAGIIWMAGKKRHMAKNSMLMIHSASGICWGNANDMREMADTLDAFDKSLITSAADSLNMSEDDMKTKYFDGKDHWLTWNEVNDTGWLTSPDDYKAAADMPQDITAMSYRDLVDYFDKTDKTNPQGQGFLQKVRAFFEESAALFGGTHSQPSPINTLDMNLEDFKKSIEDKSLDLEAVKAYLAEQTAPPATPPTEPATTTPTDNSAEIATMKAELDTLKAQVAAYGAQPSAGKAAPELPGTDLPTADGAANVKAQFDKFNKELAAAADRNESVTFVPAQ